MTLALPARNHGTAPALSLPNLNQRYEKGFEEPLMGKKFSRRSLQDDAFDAEALDKARMWVDSLQVGGLIISIGSPLDVAAKLNYLQGRSQLPLLVAADLESGTAVRLRGGTPFPRNMGVAAAGRELDAYEVGRISALEGRAVGVNIARSDRVTAFALPSELVQDIATRIIEDAASRRPATE